VGGRVGTTVDGADIVLGISPITGDGVTVADGNGDGVLVAAGVSLEGRFVFVGGIVATNATRVEVGGIVELGLTVGVVVLDGATVNVAVMGNESVGDGVLVSVTSSG